MDCQYDSVVELHPRIKTGKPNTLVMLFCFYGNGADVWERKMYEEDARELQG